jgi:hypothetical protein
MSCIRKRHASSPLSLSLVVRRPERSTESDTQLSGIEDVVKLISKLVSILLLAAIACAPERDDLAPSGMDQPLSSEDAVALAERFVLANGYTKASESEVKAQLDLESIERSNRRSELLRDRWNTLEPDALGIKATETGWGVGFSYMSHPDSCRVVTMDQDGGDIRMQHQDGICAFWEGFSER